MEKYLGFYFIFSTGTMWFEKIIFDITKIGRYLGNNKFPTSNCLNQTQQNSSA